jgi:hypothetical protein
MLIIKHLIDFSSRLLKETIIYWLLALDLAALLATYFTALHLPSWVFWTIPILAVFWGSFSIYRRGAADIRMVFREHKDVNFELTGGHEDLTQMFTGIIHGHIVNFGAHAGVLEEFSYVAGVNGIYDEFVIGHLRLHIELSPLLKKAPLYPHINFEQTDKIELPFVVNAGAIQPFSMKIVFAFSSYIQDQIDKTIEWLKEINIRINYSVRQSDGVRNYKSNFSIPTASLKGAVENAHKSREKHLRFMQQHRENI